MSADRFDELTKALAATGSRRDLLRALGAVLLGGAGAALLGQEAARADSPRRKCKEEGRPCAFDVHCCSNVCCNKVCCAGGQTCQNGACVQAGPVCSGSCVV